MADDIPMQDAARQQPGQDGARPGARTRDGGEQHLPRTTTGPRHRAEPPAAPSVPEPAPELVRRSGGVPGRGGGWIDMSAFEELFAGPSAPDRLADRVSGGRADPARRSSRPGPDPVRAQLPQRALPGVEWAVRWGDGRLTLVHSEGAARFLAGRHDGCTATYRVVGPWRPA